MGKVIEMKYDAMQASRLYARQLNEEIKDTNEKLSLYHKGVLFGIDRARQVYNPSLTFWRFMTLALAIANIGMFLWLK